MRTCQSVMESFNKRTKAKELIGATEWLDASQVLIAMMGDETDKLLDLEQAVSKAKLAILDDTTQKRTSAYADTFVEASEGYKEKRKQELFVEQIVAFVQLAKKQATLKDAEYRHQQ